MFKIFYDPLGYYLKYNQIKLLTKMIDGQIRSLGYRAKKPKTKDFIVIIESSSNRELSFEEASKLLSELHHKFLWIEQYIERWGSCLEK